MATGFPRKHRANEVNATFPAGLRNELTFTSFGRRGGTTEASTSGLTETQLMQKGQWSSTAAMKRTTTKPSLATTSVPLPGHSADLPR